MARHIGAWPRVVISRSKYNAIRTLLWTITNFFETNRAQYAMNCI